ncbi:MAG: hypothetical protein LAP21_06360, partial [Acidobacteriia bacterium]|nr:hypothetical protein [Terriglobia bacterium]
LGGRGPQTVHAEFLSELAIGTGQFTLAANHNGARLVKSLALVMGVYCIFHLYRLLLLFTVLYAM